MKYLSVLILSVILTGCAIQPPVKTVTVTKQVPVFTPPHYVMPTRPDLPIATITPSDSAQDQLKKAFSSIQILQGYAEELEGVITVIITPPTVPAKQEPTPAAAPVAKNKSSGGISIARQGNKP